jgi:signal transduction histidine kinase
MQEKLQFKISSALKDLIGRDLITDDFIAVFELVKNSYDAYSSIVNITFKDDSIIIRDNGKGMSLDDILKKWLVVAYSAKAEGNEDKSVFENKSFEDYRAKIKPKSYYAGAKGVGRFSCDRLGENLTLITKSAENNSRIEKLHVNWNDFEKDVHQEFENINIIHEHSEANNDFDLNNGTVLVIDKLRSKWGRKKLLDLKHSLEKLINPFEGLESQFSIYIECEDQINLDSNEKVEREKVNGRVGNFLFEKLEVKTTQIITTISQQGNSIETQLIDRGVELFKIREKNAYQFDAGRLDNIKIHLFYLNQAAKSNFTRLMGIRPLYFGSIFLYRNGFRVFPYGEPDSDVFNIDSRKAQKTFERLGSRDLLGRIEIVDNYDNFKESTSRDGGLIRNDHYRALKDLFENCLLRLENYVVNVQWKLEDKGEGLEKISSSEGKERIVQLIAALTDSKDIELIDYNLKFLELIEDKLSERDTNIFENLKKIASKINDDKYLDYIEKAEHRYFQEKQRREHFERQLDESKTENLFLKSLRSEQFDEIISFVHHIGISANTVDNYLKGVTKRIQSGHIFSSDEFNDILKTITFENRKIMSISKFATKANFKLFTENTTADLVNYIEEYLFNVIENVPSQNFKISVIETKPFKFMMSFTPIEMNILIDNIINNAKKASATEMIVRLTKLTDNNIEIKFIDNGQGIAPENINKIFEFGFTTTNGSGLGLFHIKKIIDDYKGDIEVISSHGKTEFVVTLNS